MRIFGSFDTQKDEAELLERLQKFGEGNALLVRRHPLYLVLHGGNAVLMLLLLAAVLTVTFFEYPDDPVALWTFVALYLAGVGAWLGMLVLHVVRKLKKASIGISNSAALADSHTGFERLVAWSLALLVFQLLVAVANFATSLALHSMDGWQIVYSLFQAAVNLVFVYLVWKLTLDLIDNEMDFIIVSPEEVVVYNQTGFFARASDSIGTPKVKSVTVQKSGIVSSFFDLGAINILTEGQDVGGHIDFDYLWKPDLVREEFQRIMRLNYAHHADQAD